MTATIATLRRLSPQVWVTGQLLPGQMAELGAAGFTCLVNHRPDHEEPGRERPPVCPSCGGAVRPAVRHGPWAGHVPRAREGVMEPGSGTFG